MNNIQEIRQLSQQELLDEFHYITLEKNEIDESPWRTFLSEFTVRNEKKKIFLTSISFDTSNLKFQKLERDPDIDLFDQKSNYLNQLSNDIEGVQKSIIFELERESSYQNLLFQIKSQLLTFRKKIVDLKSFLFYISNQEITAVDREIKISKEQHHLECALQRSEILISSDNDQIKKIVLDLQTQEKEIKNEVFKTLKEYKSLQQMLLSAQNKLQNSENNILKLENELEKKRLAKIDSQMLLLELEAVQLIAQIFLGKGFQSKEQIEQLRNQDFWITKGRYFLSTNIQNISKKQFNSEEEEYNYCYDFLQSINNGLIQQQFSLQMFYQRLSKFFSFCDNKVDEIAILLSTIYHFESLYEISLKNRYTDLIYRVQQLKVQISEYEREILNYQHKDETDQVYNNFIKIVNVGDEINFISLNLLHIHKHINLRKEEIQRIIWRFLIFFTNGIYRWVNLIITINKLVTLNKELVTKCQIILKKQRSGENEIFESQNQIARFNGIKNILSNQLNSLNNHQGVEEILLQQQELIFSYLKNDFVFYNWGSLSSLSNKLNEKIEVFRSQMNENSAYKDLLQSFTNFSSNIFIELTDEAFQNFQQFLLILLNRFIDFFRTLMLLQENKKFKIAYVEKQRRNSLTIEQNNEFRLKTPEETTMGLFGEEVGFKKRILAKKCLDYQRYFEEFKEKLVQDEQSEEYDNLNENYKITRNLLIKQSDFKSIQLEQERIKRELDKKKEKSYQERSKQDRMREKEMNQLVGLNKKLFEVISLQCKIKPETFETMKKLQKSTSSGFFTSRIKQSSKQNQGLLKKKHSTITYKETLKTDQSLRNTEQQVKKLPELSKKNFAIKKSQIQTKKKSLDEKQVPDYLLPKQVKEILTARDFNTNKNSYLLGSISSETFDQFQTRLGNQTFYSSIFSKQ